MNVLKQPYNGPIIPKPLIIEGETLPRLLFEWSVSKNDEERNRFDEIKTRFEKLTKTRIQISLYDRTKKFDGVGGFTGQNLQKIGKKSRIE